MMPVCFLATVWIMTPVGGAVEVQRFVSTGVAGAGGGAWSGPRERVASFLPWVSASWASLFKWDGTGAMPDDERKTLREFVTKAHKQGRKVRFWATPEKVDVWKELLAADVDLLNTDKLKELEKFLRADS